MPDSPSAPAPIIPPRPPAHRLRRWGLRGLRMAVTVFVVLSLLAFFLQGCMIFPGTATQGTAGAVIHPGPGEELLTLATADGQRVVALYAPALDAAGRPRADAGRLPTILYFYGNNMCANTAADDAGRFRRAGANVLVPDYLGYGMSGGSASEAGCYATADAAYDYLTKQRHVAPSLIVSTGRSLGGGPAIDLASRRPVGALATFSAFTSIADMGHKMLPFLPTSLLVRHRFENEAKLPRVRVPTFIAHGTVDGVAPFPMAARLARAAGGPVTTCYVEGGDHNDLFDVGGDALMGKFKTYLNALPDR